MSGEMTKKKLMAFCKLTEFPTDLRGRGKDKDAEANGKVVFYGYNAYVTNTRICAKVPMHYGGFVQGILKVDDIRSYLHSSTPGATVDFSESGMRVLGSHELPYMLGDPHVKKLGDFFRDLFSGKAPICGETPNYVVNASLVEQAMKCAKLFSDRCGLEYDGRGIRIVSRSPLSREPNLECYVSSPLLYR